MWSSHGSPPKILFPRKLVGVSYTRKSGLTSVGYTGESGLTNVGYTGESRLSGVAYTDESLVQPSRPVNALKGTVPQKAVCECIVWVLGKRFLFRKFVWLDSF
jgi:hypothetical protein